MNFDELPHGEDFFVSADPALMDLGWIVPTLRATYWGGHRDAEMIAKSMRESLCFGLFEHRIDPSASDRQVGFARVITDQTTFSELVDVVIDPAYRARGLGKFLVATVLRDPRISRTVINLGTRDAHAFYELLGFRRVEKMKRIPPP